MFIRKLLFPSISALALPVSLALLSCFVERGRRLPWHYNRGNEPPKREENQLKASHSSKSRGQNPGVLSQGGEAREADGVHGWWGNPNWLVTLASCTGEHEKNEA